MSHIIFMHSVPTHQCDCVMKFYFSIVDILVNKSDIFDEHRLISCLFVVLYFLSVFSLEMDTQTRGLPFTESTNFLLMRLAPQIFKHSLSAQSSAFQVRSCGPEKCGCFV